MSHPMFNPRGSFSTPRYPNQGGMNLPRGPFMESMRSEGMGPRMGMEGTAFQGLPQGFSVSDAFSRLNALGLQMAGQNMSKAMNVQMSQHRMDPRLAKDRLDTTDVSHRVGLQEAQKLNRSERGLWPFQSSPLGNLSSGFGASQLEEQNSGNQNRYNSESATSILASFGLSNEDLEELSHYPDDQLTPENMPLILRDIRMRKMNQPAQSGSGFSAGGKSGGEAAKSNVIDYGHASKYGYSDDPLEQTIFNPDLSSQDATKTKYGQQPESSGSTMRGSRDFPAQKPSNEPSLQSGAQSVFPVGGRNENIQPGNNESIQPGLPIEALVSSQNKSRFKSKPASTWPNANSGPAVNQQNFGNQPPPNFGNQAPPNFGNQAPPNFGNQAPPNFGNQAPPNFGNQAPPNFGNQAPPNFGNQAPPNFGNQAPPSFGNQAPPMLRNQAPPMLRNQAPPNFGNQAPPNFGNQAPPNLRNQAPPMLRNQAPPNFGNQAPPMFGNQAPPMFASQATGTAMAQPTFPVAQGPWKPAVAPADAKMTKRLPTPSMMNDYYATTPRIYPHMCSLCNVECRHLKDWIEHQNTTSHIESCRRLRQQYPDWNPEVLSSSRKDVDAKGKQSAKARSASPRRRSASPRHRSASPRHRRSRSTSGNRARRTRSRSPHRSENRRQSRRRPRSRSRSPRSTGVQRRSRSPRSTAVQRRSKSPRSTGVQQKPSPKHDSRSRRSPSAGKPVSSQEQSKKTADQSKKTTEKAAGFFKPIPPAKVQAFIGKIPMASSKGKSTPTQKPKLESEGTKKLDSDKATKPDLDKLKKPEPDKGKKPEADKAKKPEADKWKKPDVDKTKTDSDKVKKSDSEKAKKAEPVGAKKAEPVGAKKAEPVGAKKAEPVGAKKAEPVGAKKPEPVGAKKVEPVSRQTSTSKVPAQMVVPKPVISAPPSSWEVLKPAEQFLKDRWMDGTIIHITQLPDSGYTDQDILKVVLPFGKANDILIVRSKNEAFLEMAYKEAAEAVVDFSKTAPLLICGKQVSVCIAGQDRYLEKDVASAKKNKDFTQKGPASKAGSSTPAGKQADAKAIGTTTVGKHGISVKLPVSSNTAQQKAKDPGKKESSSLTEKPAASAKASGQNATEAGKEKISTAKVKPTDASKTTEPKAKQEDQDATCCLLVTDLPAEGYTDEDIYRMAAPFGSVNDLVILATERKAYMELTSVKAADAMLNFYAFLPVTLHGSQLKLKKLPEDFDITDMEAIFTDAIGFADLEREADYYGKLVIIDNLPEEYTELEVLCLGLRFGNVQKYVFMKNKRRAVLKLNKPGAATAMCKFFKVYPYALRDNVLNFSLSPKLVALEQGKENQTKVPAKESTDKNSPSETATDTAKTVTPSAHTSETSKKPSTASSTQPETAATLPVTGTTSISKETPKATSSPAVAAVPAGKPKAAPIPAVKSKVAQGTATPSQTSSASTIKSKAASISAVKSKMAQSTATKQKTAPVSATKPTSASVSSTKLNEAPVSTTKPKETPSSSTISAVKPKSEPITFSFIVPEEKLKAVLTPDEKTKAALTPASVSVEETKSAAVSVSTDQPKAAPDTTAISTEESKVAPDSATAEVEMKKTANQESQDKMDVATGQNGKEVISSTSGDLQSAKLTAADANETTTKVASKTTPSQGDAPRTKGPPQKNEAAPAKSDGKQKVVTKPELKKEADIEKKHSTKDSRQSTHGSSSRYSLSSSKSKEKPSHTTTRSGSRRGHSPHEKDRRPEHKDTPRHYRERDRRSSSGRRDEDKSKHSSGRSSRSLKSSSSKVHKVQQEEEEMMFPFNLDEFVTVDEVGDEVDEEPPMQSDIGKEEKDVSKDLPPSTSVRKEPLVQPNTPKEESKDVSEDLLSSAACVKKPCVQSDICKEEIKDVPEKLHSSAPCLAKEPPLHLDTPKEESMDISEDKFSSSSSVTKEPSLHPAISKEMSTDVSKDLPSVPSITKELPFKPDTPKEKSKDVSEDLPSSTPGITKQPPVQPDTPKEKSKDISGSLTASTSMKEPPIQSNTPDEQHKDASEDTSSSAPCVKKESLTQPDIPKEKCRDVYEDAHTSAPSVTKEPPLQSDAPKTKTENASEDVPSCAPSVEPALQLGTPKGKRAVPEDSSSSVPSAKKEPPLQHKTLKGKRKDVPKDLPSSAPSVKKKKSATTTEDDLAFVTLDEIGEEEDSAVPTENAIPGSQNEGQALVTVDEIGPDEDDLSEVEKNPHVLVTLDEVGDEDEVNPLMSKDSTSQDKDQAEDYLGSRRAGGQPLVTLDEIGEEDETVSTTGLPVLTENAGVSTKAEKSVEHKTVTEDLSGSRENISSVLKEDSLVTVDEVQGDKPDQPLETSDENTEEDDACSFFSSFKDDMNFVTVDEVGEDDEDQTAELETSTVEECQLEDEPSPSIKEPAKKKLGRPRGKKRKQAPGKVQTRSKRAALEAEDTQETESQDSLPGDEEKEGDVEAEQAEAEHLDIK